MMTSAKNQIGRAIVIAFIFTGLGVGGAFWYSYEQAQVRKRQICTAEIEDRVLIKDILDFVAATDEDPPPINPALPPEVQELIKSSRERAAAFAEFSNKRLRIPPQICEGTGIDINEIIDASRQGNGES